MGLHCLSCGYELTGLKDQRCPEYGDAFDPDVILALVPEGRRVYRDMTVWENLEMGAYPKRGR